MSSEYKYTYCGTLEMYTEQGVGSMPILHDNRGCSTELDTYKTPNKNLRLPCLRKDLRYAYFFGKESVYITIYDHDKGKVLFDGVLNPDSKSSRSGMVWLPKEIDRDTWLLFLYAENHAVLKCNAPILFDRDDAKESK